VNVSANELCELAMSFMLAMRAFQWQGPVLEGSVVREGANQTHADITARAAARHRPHCSCTIGRNGAVARPFVAFYGQS